MSKLSDRGSNVKTKDPTTSAQAGRERRHAMMVDRRDSDAKKELLNIIDERTTEKQKRLVSNFVSALTLHGYSQFHEAKGIRKFLWGAILITFSVAIIRLTYLSYRPENYYKQVLELEIEKMENISFPTVTICNFLPVYTHAMWNRFPVKNLTENQFMHFYYNVFSNRMMHLSKWDSNELEPETIWLNELHEKGFKTYKEALELFEKHQEDDIHSEILNKIMPRHECEFAHKSCDYAKDFRTVYRHNSQSLCKQFNFYEKGKHGLVSVGNERENGFFMFWDISGENYFYDDGLTGLLIEVHPYGTPHHLEDNRRSVYLEPGVMTDIALEEVVTHMLPYPFKPNCREEERKIAKAFPYSKATCELECILQMAVNACGCIPDQFAEYTEGLRICNVSEMRCVFQSTKDPVCADCPDECHSTNYKMSTSRLGFGSNLISKMVKEIPGWENISEADTLAYISKNIVGFRIGFKSLERHVEKYEEAVPWHERLSMLGGTMGLLLGFSVITGFEFLFFLFDYLYITIKYRCTYDYLSAAIDQEKVKMSLKKKLPLSKQDNDVDIEGQ